jgi:porphobilinogen synthase
MYYPSYRMRRLRQSPSLRRLLRETSLSVDDLVLPLIVTHGENVREPIAGMPGCFLYSIGTLLDEVRQAYEVGLRALLLYGVPSHRDIGASAAYDAEGTVQMAVKAIKDELPDMVLITDVCVCAYTDQGHCGVYQDDEVLNDVTIEVLAKVAISHAEAGADIVAPSDMMDGRVAAIRSALDDEGLFDTVLMPVASGFASGFYEPFTAAVGTRPVVGDQLTYMVDPANGEEAVREALLDIEEGADIIMIQPALPCLDVVRTVKQDTRFPLAVHSVSGEYAMLKAVAERGWLDEQRIVTEVATAIKRAGADLIITSYAKDLARWLG